MTTQVICPQCNHPAEIAPGEHPFCSHCDYPLFWVAPRNRPAAVEPEEAPRAQGLTCVVCHTVNDPSRTLCRVCGQSLVAVAPRQRRSWEAPPEPEVHTNRWKRFVIGIVLGVSLVAVVAGAAWAVWTYLWPRAEWGVVVLDQGESSWDVSATLERGLPVVAYVDASDFTLRVVICSDPFCDASRGPTLHTTVAVIGQGGQGHGTAVGVGADGRPVIAYRDGTRQALMVAHCGDPTCADPGAITITEVDPGPATSSPTVDVGSAPSLAIGVDGLPIISYHDAARGALKIAHCEDAACTTATIAVLDRTADAEAGAEGIGANSSIRIGQGGLPLVAFRDGDENSLKVARCSDERCTQAVVHTMVLEAGRNPGHDASMVLAPDGTAIVAYTDWSDDGIYLAKCQQVTCENVTVRRLDRPADGVSGDASIGFDGDGLPVVVYRQREPGDERASRILKVVRCQDLACAKAAAPVSIDAKGRTGYTPRVLLLQDGTLAVAYGDATQGALEYAVFR